MSMERKRVILGGLFVMLALCVSGRAWSQDPMTQPPHIPASDSAQTPTPAQAPSSAPATSSDPMLKQAPHKAARSATQAPEVSPAPTSTPPPRRDLSPEPKNIPPPPRTLPHPTKKSSKKQEKQEGVRQLPAPVDTAVPRSAPPASKKASKPKGKVADQDPGMRAPGAVPIQAAPAEDAPTQGVAPVANSTGLTPGPQATAPPARSQAAAAKKGKQIYNGPTTIVESPQTPMLDDDGKQRFDPEGKPMFNAPVKQQRDKKGHPLYDANGKPVFQTANNMGFDANGKKIKVKKVKEPRTTSIEISKGTLTVDGMIGKAALNYQIKDFRYVYLYAPWIGTVVVSNQAFPGAIEQAKAFDQHTLTVMVEEHQFQVYSEKIILSKRPEPAYVSVDRLFRLDSKYPAMGYGKSLQAPYSWPSAKASPESKAYVKPPPVPPNLRQTMLLAACPDGQMRPAATSPGGAPQACVAMAAPATDATPAAAPASPAAPETAPPPTASVAPRTIPS